VSGAGDTSQLDEGMSALVMPFDAAFWDRLRDEAAVHRIRTPEGPPVWLVTRYAQVQAALLDPRLSVAKVHARGEDYKGFRLPAALDAHLLNRDGTDHARLRRLVAPALSQRRIERARPGVQAVCERLLKDIAIRRGSGPVDLVAHLAAPLPLLVVCDLLGVPEPAQISLRAWAEQLLAPEPAQAPRARDTLARMGAIVQDLIAAKRVQPGDDVTSALIAARDDGDRLSQDELTSMIFYLLFVFYEVTVDQLAAALLAVSRDDRGEDLRTPARLSGLVDELLRHDAPQLVATPRFPLQDLEIAGAMIPAGDTVLLALAAANRDPERFTAPEILDPARDANPHLAFGAGIHRCLGAPLVRLQAEIVLEQVLWRWPALRLAVEPADLRWREGMRHRGLRELPVLL